MPSKRTIAPVTLRKARATTVASKAPPDQKAANRASKATASSHAKAGASRGLGRVEVLGLAGQFVTGWRKDMAAIVEARNRSYAGMLAVVRRQVVQVREAIGEWRTVGTVMASIGPRRSVGHADKLVVAALQLALADIRDLVGLAAGSQRDAFEILQRRFKAHLDDVQRTSRPGTRIHALRTG